MTDPLVVLQSLTRVGPETNPYLRQLIAALGDLGDVRVDLFSYRQALLGRYDVFHVHWPEQLVGGHRTVGRIARRLLTAAVVARLRLFRTPVVRTVHNVHRPDGLGRLDHALLTALDRSTTVWVRLNERTDVAGPAVTIPHGHYRDWFTGHDRAAAVPGRISYVGLIRRYKGVERLIEQFRRTRRAGLTLAVSGKPSSEQLRVEVQSLSDADSRITTALAYLDDAALVRAVTEAELVVLPYQHMHNSGMALAALSLDRPVLVPDNPVNRDLRAEVGDGWVLTYRDDLTAGDLDAAMATIASHPGQGQPDLSARDWPAAACRHRDAYRRAILSRRGQDT
ncbi:glycosyltransferase [Tersicoccus sp. MR15.9]|uniref:glycosyltransferase n=1 Tax=Tersicoccus mangrovi TaxID=3121635 RepID=UPI002FE6416E